MRIQQDRRCRASKRSTCAEDVVNQNARTNAAAWEIALAACIVLNAAPVLLQHGVAEVIGRTGSKGCATGQETTSWLLHWSILEGGHEGIGVILQISTPPTHVDREATSRVSVTRPRCDVMRAAMREILFFPLRVANSSTFERQVRGCENQAV